MKLLFCDKCLDIIKLTKIIKSCKCGKTKGKYIDSLRAVYSGDHAIPIGIDNYDFIKALNSQPEKGIGKIFNAFVIPKKCETFIKVNKIS